MTTETKCVVAEQIGEALLGGAIGMVVTKQVLPKFDGVFEKTTILLGTAVGSWMIGRAFAKQFAKYCDNQFGTDLEEESGL